MRKTIAYVWVMIPPLILSALIHCVDPDVGGVKGLASPSTVLSVVVCGVPLAGVALLCFWLAVRYRWTAWVSLSVLFSLVVALALVLLQSPPPAGPAGIALPLIGGTLLVWLFLLAAVLPSRALWRSR